MRWLALVPLLACDSGGILGFEAREYHVAVLAEYGDVSEVAPIDINRAGDVVWNERSGDSNSFVGVLWRAGEISRLPMVAIALSEGGAVVGNGLVSGELSIWRDGEIVGRIPDEFRVLGWAEEEVALTEVDSLVYLWDGGGLSEVRLPQLTDLRVRTVREDGAILGQFRDLSNLRRCFVFAGGTVVHEFIVSRVCTPVASNGEWVVAEAFGGLCCFNGWFLHDLSGGESLLTEAVLRDVNSRGSGVGVLSEEGGTVAVLVSGDSGREIILNDGAQTDADVFGAFGVNDHGQILALGREQQMGHVQVLLLTPLRD